MGGYGDLGLGEQLLLAAQAMNTTRRGGDGFLQTMGLADKMVKERKAARQQKATTGFLDRVLSGSDPAAALREYPDVDQGQVQGFVDRLLSKQAAAEQDVAAEKRAVSAFDRQQTAAVAAEGRDRAGKIADEQRAQSTNEELARRRSLAGGFLDRLQARKPPAGTSVIPRKMGGYLERLGIAPEAAAADAELAEITPGWDLALEQAKGQGLEARKAESIIGDRAADNLARDTKIEKLERDNAQLAGFLDAVTRSGGKIPEGAFTAAPGAAKVGAGLVKQDIGLGATAQQGQLNRAAARERLLLGQQGQNQRQEKALGTVPAGTQASIDAAGSRQGAAQAQRALDSLRTYWRGKGTVPPESAETLKKEIARLKALGAK